MKFRLMRVKDEYNKTHKPILRRPGHTFDEC